MPTEVLMPKLGLTMETGSVQRWLAAPGERLESSQPLLEVETDKVVVEVETPAAGILGPWLIRAGETVPIGTLLARVYAPGEPQVEAAPSVAVAAEQRPRAPSPGSPPRITPLARRVATDQGVAVDAVRGSGAGGRITAEDVRNAAGRERIFSSPRARKLAREVGLDWRAVPGSGPRGRVIERDVVQARGGGLAMALDAEDVTWEAPTRVQRVAAGRMTASFGAAPHFYLSAEAHADALLALRERLIPAVERRAGVRLTLSDLLAKIVAAALREHPRANAFWDPEGGGRIGLRRQVHLGLAAATEAGLVVPVLRDADGMGLAQIAAERSRLVEKARQGRLSPDDLEGSTFTLTNLGMHRVDIFQAILNPPQSAILVAGRIAERPAVVDGQLCVRPTMFVTLSCDHRVLDGVTGAQFLGRVVELIEEPHELMV